MKTSASGVAKMSEMKKRKVFLLYPGFQLLFIFYNLILFGLFSAFMGMRIYNSFRYMFSLGEKAELPAGHPFYQYLNYQQELLLHDLVLSGSIFLLVSLLFAAVLSHKVAGPFHRTRVFLNDFCRTRELRELKFRKFDFFQDIAGLINRALRTAVQKNDSQPLDGHPQEDKSANKKPGKK